MSSPDSPNGRVFDNSSRHRYELDVDGTLAFIDYTRSAGEISFDHTEVPASLGGKGVGSRLAQGALALARDAGLKVVPRCSFIASYIERHPEFAGLTGN